MATNSAPNRVFYCIFCKSKDRKLTAEHVYPHWLRPYIERTGRKNRHWTTFHGSQPAKGKLDRPGDGYDQKLRVVCDVCNSGWMSRLQSAAKPHLLPLILDKSWNLSTSEQDLLSRWATMTTMVLEFADIKTACVPQSHRTHLMNSSTMPQHWAVWIGRHDAEGDHSAFFNHFGAKFILPFSYSQVLPAIHYFQSAGFTVGNLIVQTCMMTPPFPGQGFQHKRFADAYDLRTIHSSSGPIKTKPNIRHGKISRQIISTDAARGLDLPVFFRVKEIPTN